MNILIINHYAGSPHYGMEFRCYYLAKEWVKLGHRVAIVGSNYSHLRSDQPKVQKDLQKEDIDNIYYYWLKTPRYSKSGLKRIVNMITFVIKLLMYKNKIRQLTNPDIVIASSTYPLDIYPANLIAKINKAKLVFELHDLWPLSPIHIGGYSKYHPFIWIMQQAENFACKNCDCYISLLSNTKDYLVKHGLKENKFFHIPNGFSLEELNEGKETIPIHHEEKINEIRQKHKILIGYAGGIAPSNAMRTFLDVGLNFKEENKLAFVIVGNGPQKLELISISKGRMQTNVYFLPPVQKKSIPDLLEKFDLLFAGGTKSILHSYGTSFNKVTDYMLAEKPIIFAVDEPNSLVERVGCGFQIAAEDEKELLKAINLLSEMSIEERSNIGKKGKEYAINSLNYTSLAKMFLTAVDQCEQN